KPQPVGRVEALPPVQGGPTPGVTRTDAFASPVGGNGDYDALQARLKGHRVTYQRQETYQDGYKFTCVAQHPTNPNRERQYEAIARDYRSAILAVLEQMDQGR